MTILDSIGNALGLTNPDMRKPTEGFSINEFRSNVLNKGLLKNNLYLAYFEPKSKISRELVFYTSNIQIPAADLATVDIRRYGYGPIERYPYRPLFAGDMNMDFYTEASDKSVMQEMFKNLSRTSNFMNYGDFAVDSSKTDVPVPGTEDENTGLPTQTSKGPEPYLVEYRDNISFNIEVYVYNENSDKIITYRFRDCFVRMVGSVGLSWEQDNTLIKTSVGFAFTDFSVNVADGSSGEGVTSLSSLQSILKLGTIAQTISAIKKPRSVGDAINILNNATVIRNGLSL